MIHFRRVDEPFADARVERWQVEFYSDEGTMFPVGLAWVLVFDSHAQLQFFMVADDWRGQGVGRRLLEACRERWSMLRHTSPMTPLAEKLLRSVFPEQAHEESEE